VNYREIIKILTSHGFGEVRCKGSHHLFEGMQGGRKRLVTVSYHKLSDDVLPKNLGSMIRQSGLSKKDFR